jgi:hypothetical protein
MGLFKALGSLLGRTTTTPTRDWDDPLDIAVTTVAEVASGERPVLLVTRDEGVGGGLGGWQFLDGMDLAGRSAVAIAKPELLALDPSLAEVKDLPVGWSARRTAIGQPWARERSSGG